MSVRRRTATPLAALAIILSVAARPAVGQQPAPRDTTPRTLERVRVVGRVAPRTVTSLPEKYGAALLTGRKTEVLLVDSVGANAAQNVARQVLGRVPGLVVSETEGSGFPSNGIAVRGLDPTQSVEMNVRQNGVIVSADPYGYNEAYYVPPLEAVERVELVRGASALQFGPQFGGMVNYVMKRGDPSRRLAGDIQQTVGSYGLSNTYGSLSGGARQWRWFAYTQRRAQDGWRPNSDLLQTSGYASLTYAASPALTATLDYSLLRNRIHMPGGLSDEQFESGARQSFRSRNWLTSPWNVGALTLDWQPSTHVRVQSVTSVLGSGRSLVWRNEDGGPGALDELDPATGEFVSREVEREAFRNATEEVRLLADHHVLGTSSTLALGARWFNGQMHRQGGGEGTTGGDFDLALTEGTYEYDIRYAQSAASAWIENAVRLGGPFRERVTLTPGLRVERLQSRADGYTDTTFTPRSKRRTVPLLALGASWLSSATTNVYANVAQAYRPIDYTALTPIGGVSRIDPNMRDAHGTNADLGWRGTLADDRVRFDVDVFHLTYDGRVGIVARTASGGATFTERTNAANSVHQGLESYVEVTPVRAFTAFNSLALLDAHYTSGEFEGNRVEYAPRAVERAGLTASHGAASTTFVATHVSRAYGDAENVDRNDDAVVGIVPSYTVLDWSATVRAGQRWRVQAGVNNITDRHYFTRRTDEYPGPGIIPSAGRSVYLSARATR